SSPLGSGPARRVRALLQQPVRRRTLSMKLQPDRPDVQTLTARGPGWVAINGERYEHSVVLGSREERFAWGCARFDDLGPAQFAQLADLGAEVVIFGSGERIRFP